MQPLDSETALIKISHCKKDIFCPYVPKYCPLCGQSVSYRKLEDAPVSIPSPFVNGHREKCSFLLKPTAGTFLRGYDGSSDLHVGITNTKGLVYNYNETGISISEHGWEQCVNVPLVQPDMYALLQQWDKYLEQFSAAEIWLPYSFQHLTAQERPKAHDFTFSIPTLVPPHTFQEHNILATFRLAHLNHLTPWVHFISFELQGQQNIDPCWHVSNHRLKGTPPVYEEYVHNCYTYALTFINCVLSAQGKQQMNKSEFTETFVIPRTRKASKYITIYKEICKNGFYVVDRPEQEDINSTGNHLL